MASNGNGCCWIQERLLSRTGSCVLPIPKGRHSATIFPACQPPSPFPSPSPSYCKVVWVPGCFEIGIVAEQLGKSRKYQAILCIGAVTRGNTSHYDAVANSAASGVLSAGLNSGVPCIFGVLTCDDVDQALNRAGGKSGNKGAECGLTVVT